MQTTGFCKSSWKPRLVAQSYLGWSIFWTDQHRSFKAATYRNHPNCGPSFSNPQTAEINKLQDMVDSLQQLQTSMMKTNMNGQKTTIGLVDTTEESGIRWSNAQSLSRKLCYMEQNGSEGDNHRQNSRATSKDLDEEGDSLLQSQVLLQVCVKHCGSYFWVPSFELFLQQIELTYTLSAHTHQGFRPSGDSTNIVQFVKSWLGSADVWSFVCSHPFVDFTGSICALVFEFLTLPISVNLLG